MKTKACLVPTLSAALIFAATPSFTQVGSGMLQNSGLSKEDMEMAQDAAMELLNTEGVAEGDEVIWSNPESDALGVVETTAIEEDGRCIAFKHLVRAKPGNDVVRYDSRRCRDGEGKWLLAPK